jgi:PAS domain S-box-containing protein
MRLKRNQGIDEIGRLIELLPGAAILANVKDQRVILVNSQAIELTTYMRNELTNKRLRDLFSDPGGQDLESLIKGSDPIRLTLARRDKSTQEVQAKFEPVSSDGQTVLIVVEPAEESREQVYGWEHYRQMFGSLSKLSAATQQSDAEQGLLFILRIGQELTSATHIAVYHMNGPNMELTRQASIGTVLPEELPAQDIISLRNAQIWVPGRRSHTHLHNLARAAGFSYLASVPIGDPHAIIGVLVLADNNLRPTEQTLPLLQVVAGAAHNVIQHFSRLSHLEAKIEEKTAFQRIVDVAQDYIQDSILVLTPDLKVMMFNLAAELCLGYKEQEALNLPVQSILIGNQNLMPALQLAQQGIPTLKQDNVTLLRRSGEVFQANVSTLPVKHGNQLEGIVVAIQDLTEREAVRSRAEQLEQQALLGTVTAIFAHEVRNPLNNLSSGLQLMAYQLPPNDPQHDLINSMQADCDRLEELMKNVLIFSRATEYDMEPVDLGLLVRRQIERMRPRLNNANVQSHLSVEPSTPLIMGNARALEQIFSNLFVNALQAMESNGGILGVKVQPAETTGNRRYAVVTVADNGPGIPKEILERVFDPFFTTKSSGTGLGLAITKRIVTAHKGIIQATSYPGATLFTVQIPAIQPQQPNDSQ